MGVHLSFVRSVTMDKWKESELEKMKVGGNRKMKSFLEERDESSLPIRTKYNTKAASLYKDKVKLGLSMRCFQPFIIRLG